MSKRKEDLVPEPVKEKPVRYVGAMMRADRARFRYFCEVRGLNMEDVGVQWILERLAQEEAKGLPHPRRPR